MRTVLFPNTLLKKVIIFFHHNGITKSAISSNATGSDHPKQQDYPNSSITQNNRVGMGKHTWDYWFLEWTVYPILTWVVAITLRMPLTTSYVRAFVTLVAIIDMRFWTFLVKAFYSRIAIVCCSHRGFCNNIYFDN